MYHCIRMRTIMRGSVMLAVILCLCVWMRSVASVPVQAKPATKIVVPIIMYHSILRDESRAGPYVVSPAQFEEDLCYLLDKGYTPVFVSELIDYGYDGVPLPDKPVVITLDDGFLNNAIYVLPILQKHHTKAVISVVGGYTERFSREADPNPNYAYLTWEDIRVLNESGCVEIANHTYDMHSEEPRNGCARKDGESLEAYREALNGDIGRMQQQLWENSGVLPLTFTYPFGALSEDATEILKEMGFQAALTCSEYINTLTGDPEELFSLGRFNRPSGISTEQFMKRIGIE